MRAKEPARKGRLSQAKEQSSTALYDRFWQRGNFLAAKTAAEQPVRAPGAPRPPRDENRPACANPVQRFSLTKSFGAVDFERLAVGPGLKGALAAGLSPGEARAFEAQLLARESVLKKYLLRFVLVSRRQSWQRKYRPTATDQVFSAGSAEQVREWVQSFFERKEEAADKSLLLDADLEVPFRSSDKKSRVPDHRGHAYRCLVLLGKPGVGKTSAVEAICAENGFHLEAIDCTWFGSFADLKKKYAEAVKSQAVGPTARRPNEQPSLSPFRQFFKQASAEPCKPGAEPEPEAAKPRKKVFLLNNFDCFFDREPDADQAAADRLGKQLVEFSDFSSFPFIVEATDKSKVGLHFDAARFFDLVRFADPEPGFCAWVLLVVARLETDSRRAEDPASRKYHEHELVDKSCDWQAIAQQALDRLAERLAAAPADSRARKIGLQQLEAFLRAHDFDLHRVIADLSFQICYSGAAVLAPRLPGLAPQPPASARDPAEETDLQTYFRRAVRPELSRQAPQTAQEAEDAEFLRALRRRHVRAVEPDLLTLFKLLSAEPPAELSPLRPAPGRACPAGERLQGGSRLLGLLKTQFEVPESKDCLIFEYLSRKAQGPPAPGDASD